jgi:hypothetical protein
MSTRVIKIQINTYNLTKVASHLHSLGIEPSIELGNLDENNSFISDKYTPKCIIKYAELLTLPINDEKAKGIESWLRNNVEIK